MQNLNNEVQQHQLTIQQLTQQVQALTSLKRSRSTSEAPASDLDSAAVSQVTDIDIATFPGLEGKNGAKAGERAGDSTADSIAAVGRGKPTIRTVDLGDEVRLAASLVCISA